MERKLSKLFDYQKFEGNASLQSVIDSVHRRYAIKELDDDDLFYVAAAGVPDQRLKKRSPEEGAKQ